MAPRSMIRMLGVALCAAFVWSSTPALAKKDADLCAAVKKVADCKGKKGCSWNGKACTVATKKTATKKAKRSDDKAKAEAAKKSEPSGKAEAAKKPEVATPANKTEVATPVNKPEVATPANKPEVATPKLDDDGMQDQIPSTDGKGPGAAGEEDF